MAKEWAKWEQLNATKPVSRSEVASARSANVQIVGTRWVLTRKSTGDIKGRLVVQGCQERGNTIRSDSPTGSLTAFYATLAFCRLEPMITTRS